MAPRGAYHLYEEIQMLITRAVSGALTPPVFCPVFPTVAPVVTGIEWNRRRIPLSHGSVRGFHPGRDEAIPFESLLECHTIDALLRFSQVKRVRSQPVTLRFTVGEIAFRYTPDLLVEFTQVPDELAALGYERSCLIECKPTAKLPKNAELLGRAYAALRTVSSLPLLIVSEGSLAPAPWGDAHGS
jgi:hypothetical protein